MKAVKIKHSDTERVRVALMKMQSNRCCLCGDAFGPKGLRPALDHDHKTGYIRGVLCLWCNGMLGKVANAAQRAVGRTGNRAPWVEAVAQYLTKHATPAYAVPGVRTGLIYPTHKTPEDKRLARLEKAKKKRKQARIMKKVG